MPTDVGDFKLYAFRNMIDETVHMALVKGEPDPDKPVLVRVHVESPICDTFGSLRKDCGWPLRDAMKRIADEGEGVVIILRLAEESDMLVNKIKYYGQQDAGEEMSATEHGEDLRTYGIGAQILKDLGVSKMRVLSAPRKMHALSGFDLEVVEYVYDESH
jgi:3,4-dihydroxy 2-butanone 4-phosphate synthase/GTP cyclohydrolase II